MMIFNEVPFPDDTLFLVTGGAGFIGSHLCETILNMGYRVRCLDNLSTGFQSNVAIHFDNPLFTFIYGDIQDCNTCRKACEKVDYVFHEAAFGSVPRSLEEPLLYEQNNVMGTLNLLEAARRCNVKRVVYASSSSVYGDCLGLPKKEGNEGKPLSPYALTKRSNEEWAKQYTQHFGLETIGLRYFNVFGPRQNPGGAYAAVIPKFIMFLLRNESPIIYGDGMQSRDFTYVDNVVEANLRACLASQKSVGKVFNIACGNRKHLCDVYTAIAEEINSEVKPIYDKERRGDIRDSFADISQAAELLGYSPNVNFTEGLHISIMWYRRVFSDSN